MSSDHRRRIRISVGLLIIVSTAACGRGRSEAANSVTCQSIRGSIAFTPALTLHGDAPEVVHIDLAASGCRSPNSSSSIGLEAAITGEILGSVNSCTNILLSRPVTATIRWMPRAVPPSLIMLSGYDISANASKDEGFTLPNVGGHAEVTGSFTGADHGGASKASIFSNETVNAILAQCQSTVGLEILSITSGRFVLS